MQTEEAPAVAVPPAEGGEMETIAVVDVAGAHTPLVTMAYNWCWSLNWA